MPLRKELGWLSIKEMIATETSILMYKSLSDLAPKCLSDLLVRLSDFHTRELRNTKNDLAVPLMRIVSGQRHSHTVVQKCGTSLTTISKRPPRYTHLNQG